MLTVVAAMLAAVVGTGLANGASSTKLPGKGVKFGISLPGLSSPGSVGIVEGLKCYANRVGGSVQGVDPGQDINKQISQVTDMINGGVKAVMISPFSPSVIKALTPKAKAKGAYIIELGNPKSPASGSVSGINAQIGKLAATHMKDNISGEVRAVMIGGPPIPFAQALENGFTNAASQLGIKVLEVAHATQFNTTTGRTIAADLLTKHPDANAIFVIEPSLGIGAGLAAKARGSKIEVDAQGATPQTISAIKSGTMTAIVDTQLAKYGFAGGKVGAKLVAKQKVSPVKIPNLIVDKSNVAKWKSPKAQCSSLR
ncbi:MAG TPA: sugar ABC transporter substrate-binding protein [Solirubrobacteraceae bacterium]|nr:sugar ABC transporter substrate-binding protein [Solirubrobacteraceae bacterium]